MNCSKPIIIHIYHQKFYAILSNFYKFLYKFDNLTNIGFNNPFVLILNKK